MMECVSPYSPITTTPSLQQDGGHHLLEPQPILRGRSLPVVSWPSAQIVERPEQQRLLCKGSNQTGDARHPIQSPSRLTCRACRCGFGRRHPPSTLRAPPCPAQKPTTPASGQTRRHPPSRPHTHMLAQPTSDGAPTSGLCPGADGWLSSLAPSPSPQLQCNNLL